MVAVAFCVISRRNELVLPPRARVHHNTIGEAMKIEEYVPTATPMMIASEKSRRTAPPNRKRHKIGINVTVLVKIVRLNV